MLEVISKRTDNVTDDEFNSLVALFKDAFDRTITVEAFRSLFTNNQFGYSLHNFLYEDGVIIGHNAGMPVFMIVEGVKVKAVNNVSLMISKRSRGLSGFVTLMKSSYAFYEKEGVQLLYSLPNDNSYPLLTKLKFMKDVSSLCVYCLPYRLSGIKPSVKHLDFLSAVFSKSWIGINRLFTFNKEHVFSIHKDMEGYEETRYKRAADYKFVSINNNRFVYRIQEYLNVRAAFLIDVYSKSASHFSQAVNYIVKNEKNQFDIILYIGYLPFKYHGMIKVPKKYEPKSFRLVYHIFDDKTINNDIVSNICNWDISLSDDDII